MNKTKQNNERECSLTQSLAERLEEGKDNKDNQGQERKKSLENTGWASKRG